MREEILVRYARHYKAIKTIGAYPLYKDLQLSDLGETPEMKAIAQRCYTDKKKLRWDEISVIDFLCLISAHYLLSNVPVSERTAAKGLKYIIDNYEGNLKEETRNTLRIFVKRPEVFFKNLRTEDVEIYKEMVGFWLKLYIQDFNKEYPDYLIDSIG